MESALEVAEGKITTAGEELKEVEKRERTMAAKMDGLEAERVFAREESEKMKQVSRRAI